MSTSGRNTHDVFIWPRWMSNPQIDTSFDGSYRPPASEFYMVAEYIDQIVFKDGNSYAQEKSFTNNNFPGTYLNESGQYIFSDNFGQWCEAYNLYDPNSYSQQSIFGFMNFA